MADYSKATDPRITWLLVMTISLIRRCYCITIVEEPMSSGAVGADRHVQVFTGEREVPDHFNEMFLAGGWLIVGARNVVYNISLDTFQENSRIEWSSSLEEVEFCQLRKRTEEECQNYIRVIALRSDNTLLVCGTNAFRPLCRTYSFDQSNGYSVLEMESGVARCPYNPSHNSTAVYVGQHLYSATVADLTSRDALIYRRPMRTEQHDSQWLNEPNFVSSFGYEDKVYFFFREMAVENINCGKSVFSRVARVCTNDQGGARVLRNTWTSFFKARLNCSVPGEFPFYFDEIQSTSLVGEGHVFPSLQMSDRLPMVYAVFTTPRNSLRGSAICAFKMSDIISSFEGPFKEQRSSQSNWLPVRDADVPDPHPAKTCPNDSSMYSDQTLNFIKSHPLMDRAVPAFGGQPVLVQSNLDYSLTKIAVDWQVFSANKRHYDVMFIGTDDGKVLKAINRGRDQLHVEPTVIEVYQVFESGRPVTGLNIHRNGHKSKLVVMSRDEVRAVPLHRCHLRLTCSDCVALRDPYCSWVDSKCSHSTQGIQSIETGRHSQCPLLRASKMTVVPSTTTASARAVCPPCLCKQKSLSRRAQASTLPTTTTTVRSTTKTTTKILEDYEGFIKPRLSNDEANDEMLQYLPADSIGPCFGESIEDGTSYTDDDGYSGSMVALIAILCTGVSLVAGFIIGFGVSWYRYQQQQGSHSQMDTKKGVSDRSGIKCSPKGSGLVENWYDPDPVKTTFRSFSKEHHKDLGVESTPKLHNINTQVPFYVNDIKKNNSAKVANSSVETTLRPPPRRHRTVHL